MILYGTNPIAWSNDDDWSIGDHLSLEDCLGDCRKIGFDGIEKGHKMPDEGSALKAKLAEYGLRFAAGWHSTNILVNDIQTEITALQAWIDFTRAAGGDHINACECSNTVHGNDKVAVNDRPIMTDAEWERFSKGYEELSRHAAGQGVRMGYHHHMGTIIKSAADIDRFMAMAGPHTRLLLDTGHAYFAWRGPGRGGAQVYGSGHPYPLQEHPTCDYEAGARREPFVPGGGAARGLHGAGRRRGMRRL